MNISIDITKLREIYERAEKIKLVLNNKRDVISFECRCQSAEIMREIDEVIRPKHEQAEPGRNDQC